tara:strand:- start:353 stop:547 length:195 start_codon:yes stop_codon:yes gene_type:complete
MEEWYNKEEDILNIEVASGDYWKSIELPNGVIIDLNKDGKIKGIEILKASKIFSGDAKKVIELT